MDEMDAPMDVTDDTVDAMDETMDEVDETIQWDIGEIKGMLFLTQAGLFVHDSSDEEDTNYSNRDDRVDGKDIRANFTADLIAEGATRPLTGRYRSWDDRTFIELFGLSKSTLATLEHWTLRNTTVTASRKNSGPDVAGKLLIFLHYVRAGNGVRATSKSLKKSESIVSRSVDEILQAFQKLHDHFVLRVMPRERPPLKVTEDPKFHAFRDAIGAMNGVHVHANVKNIPTAKQEGFRNSSGRLTQNVLVRCGFDSTYQYVLAGWKGSATNPCVENDARKRGFLLPRGKYYLCDSGYFNSVTALTPYPDVPYDLQETSIPHNKEELFNLRHAALRHEVDRTFRLTRQKFKILWKPEFPEFKKQAYLVIALTGLWNFIQAHEGAENDAQVFAEDLDHDQDDQPPVKPIVGCEPSQFGEAMDKRRDVIAAELWEQYHRTSAVVSRNKRKIGE